MLRGTGEAEAQTQHGSRHSLQQAKRGWRIRSARCRRRCGGKNRRAVPAGTSSIARTVTLDSGDGCPMRSICWHWRRHSSCSCASAISPNMPAPPPAAMIPFTHARTTYAGLWERATVAPYWVNYHSEHHLFMGVPCYSLPLAHALLGQGGYHGRMTIAPDYRAVLRLVTASPTV